MRLGALRVASCVNDERKEDDTRHDGGKPEDIHGRRAAHALQTIEFELEALFREATARFATFLREDNRSSPKNRHVAGHTSALEVLSLRVAIERLVTTLLLGLGGKEA